MESGVIKQNSLRNFRKYSAQETTKHSPQEHWEIPEDGKLIIKEEIKVEEDIEICEIRVINPSHGTPTLLQRRPPGPPQLQRFGLSKPVSQVVEFPANYISLDALLDRQIESEQYEEQPRGIPVILPQHNQDQIESIRSTSYTSYLNTSSSSVHRPNSSPSSVHRPNSASYPQQRQDLNNSPSSVHRPNSSSYPQQRQTTTLAERDDSPITSTRPILPKPSMPNLIPLMEEATKSPPPYIEPSIRVVEHPRENNLRFRYECEGRSAGSLQGVTSTASNKTFPSIEILNYRGPAVVVVSCVNATGSPLTHPHNLVGKDCKKGVCTININNDSMFCAFTNLGVQCVRRKDVDKSLTQRQGIRVDPFKLGFQHKNAPLKIDLNAVRLCYQVFIIGQQGKFTKKLEPVLSTPVYDAKAKKDLQIIEISDDNSSVDGGRKIVILCEKVAKEDIQVNFFEEDEDGNRTWEALGDFTQNDVHKQYGICLKTPMYKNRAITSPVRVNIELRTKFVSWKDTSDVTSTRTDNSDPLPFFFTPSTSPHAMSPTPTSPFFQSQFSMVEVSNSISEEDLPTVLIPSHVATVSEDDVTRAVYSMGSVQSQTNPPAMQRQPVQRQSSQFTGRPPPQLQRQTTKMSRPHSTSNSSIQETQDLDDLDVASGVSPQKRVKL